MSHHPNLPAFDRSFFTGEDKMTVIGTGSIGGKARGLLALRDVVETEFSQPEKCEITVDIPTLTVIATDYFDQFLELNDLYAAAKSESRDDLLAHTFQRADLPVQLVGDLRALIEQVHTPLAVRSSSMLEDAMFEPFAGIYATKMIPNNQHDPDLRFRKLVEAIKFVYASTFFRGAREYLRMTRHTSEDEKMAVILQEVVGSRFSDRYYPHISGVARSYNFYSTSHARPEDGVVELALGLGRTIVDDGMGWMYSPAYPGTNPPFNNIADLLKQSQLRFWAVNMGRPPAFDPIRETEYLIQGDLMDAERDGALKFIASTFDARDDRIVMGTRGVGPRIIDFAPILKAKQIPLNDTIQTILRACEDLLKNQVEIEFAVTLDADSGAPAQLSMLQVRPMVVSRDYVEVQTEELSAPGILAASESVLGNGVLETIHDIVYVKPGSFSAAVTHQIPQALENINSKLVAENRPYLLIGFGRWGTSDPQAGIPVDFSQISGARAIVEATLPQMNFTLSQGSHFFHNVTSFRIFYFSVRHTGRFQIDWQWLGSQTVVTEDEFVRHCVLTDPLEIRVDGTNGRGFIRHD